MHGNRQSILYGLMNMLCHAGSTVIVFRLDNLFEGIGLRAVLAKVYSIVSWRCIIYVTAPIFSDFWAVRACQCQDFNTCVPRQCCICLRSTRNQSHEPTIIMTPYKICPLRT